MTQADLWFEREALKYFEKIGEGLDVAPLQIALKLNEDLWGKHTFRKCMANTPHKAMDDIWVRYNDIEKCEDMSKFNHMHFPIWYEAWYKLPQLRPLVFGLMARFEATHLGGILITRIPPGGRIEPHKDAGWHPEFYKTKIYIPIASNPNVINRCEDEYAVMRAGEIWYFNNLVEHEVINNGDSERITLIISMKTDD